MKSMLQRCLGRSAAAKGTLITAGSFSRRFRRRESFLTVDALGEFVFDWTRESPETINLLRVDEDIMVKVMKALGDRDGIAIATSFPNRGAVSGFKERTVLEYSQVLGRDGLRPVAAELEVPDMFQGLVSALATHQTLLGDAIATRDPRILFEALYSYPVKRDTADSKALWRDLLEVAGPTIPPEFQKAREMFRS